MDSGKITRVSIAVIFARSRKLKSIEGELLSLPYDGTGVLFIGGTLR